jgi:hypothetical protein
MEGKNAINGRKRNTDKHGCSSHTIFCDDGVQYSKKCKEITDAILQFWWDKNMEDARVVESSSDWLELKVWTGNYPSLCNEAMISCEKMHSVRIVACHFLF